VNQVPATAQKSEPSPSPKRWDYICLAILIVPLVVLAFQGDLIIGLAERVNWHGQFTVIHACETELQGLTAQRVALATRTRTAAESAVNTPHIVELKQRETALELEISELREPFNRTAGYWNFSFVGLWPLSLLLLPLVGALLWFSVPSSGRREMFAQAQSRDARAPGWVAVFTGRTFSAAEAPQSLVPARPRAVARNRGLIIGLAAIGLLWLAGWINGSLDQAVFDHRGFAGFQPPSWMTWGTALALASYVLWTAGFVYAFTGWRGLGRLWVPAAAIMALVILNYGPDSRRWAVRWDDDPNWSYGYFIGPIAAYLFYCLLTEKLSLFGKSLPKGAVADLSIFALWPMVATRAVMDRNVAGDLEPGRLRAGRTLLLWGLIGTVGVSLFWAVARHGWLGDDARAWSNLFGPYPLLCAVAILALGAWQTWDKNRRGEDSIRLAGLAIVAAGLAWRVQAAESHVSFLDEISFVIVLFGAVLAWFGSRVIRVAWVPLLLLTLAIPWPDRAYRLVAAGPQEWAATIASRVMYLIGYHETHNTGTLITVGPLASDKLEVAVECSGLHILFAFLAVSVVYAFISPRPAWRRAIIFISAFPIAIFANFTRVFVMALFYRRGYKIIAEGMTHQMVGYLMLVEAGLLLYLEMRALDIFERLAEYFSGESGPGQKPAEPPAP
jgi:exosortase